MSEVAPSCPISHTQQKITTSQQLRGINADNIPPARDLRSVITAINSISNIVQRITRAPPQINNFYPTTVAGVPEPNSPPPVFRYADVKWKEEDRSYRQGKVINPDNTSQFVPISTISRVEWSEENTYNKVVYED